MHEKLKIVTRSKRNNTKKSVRTVESVSSGRFIRVESVAMLLFVAWISTLLSCISAACIKGKLDIGSSNITGATVARSQFRLHQIGNYSGNFPYTSKARISNSDGLFEFDAIPLNRGVNASTHYVLSASSLDFNLKPNRVLFEFVNKDDDGEHYQVKAYRNIFGKEYFPSPDITYPEELEPIVAEPFITIELINRAPLRLYYQQRNKGLLTGGPFASLLDARWKQAMLVALIGLLVFPVLLERFDPETAKAIKEEKVRKQKAKYKSE